jgi:putative ABC transport system permease protein
MLAIAMGFTAVSIFDGFMQDIKNQVNDSYIHEGMLGHVVIQKKGSKDHYFEDMWKYTLNEEDQKFLNQTLKTDTRVDVFAHFLIASGFISSGSSTGIFISSGYDIENGLKIRGGKWAWNTIAGKPLHQDNPNSVILGVELAKKMNCEKQGPLQNQIAMNLKPIETPFECANPQMQLSATTEQAQVNAVQLKPIGAIDFQLREINQRFIMMPIEAAQTLFDTKSITRYSVLLKNESDSPQFIADLDRLSKEQNKDFEFIKWFDHPAAAVAKGGLEILNVFKLLFLSVVSIISAMSVANTMMKSINERVREIGTLRSLGFKSNDIVNLFSIEGFFMGLFSCFAGFALTLTIAFIINHSGLSFKAGLLSTPLPLGIAMSYSTWIASTFVLCFISFASSFFISRQIAKMNIAETLRYVS